MTIVDTPGPPALKAVRSVRPAKVLTLAPSESTAATVTSNGMWAFCGDGTTSQAKASKGRTSNETPRGCGTPEVVLVNVTVSVCVPCVRPSALAFSETVTGTESDAFSVPLAGVTSSQPSVATADHSKAAAPMFVSV